MTAPSNSTFTSLKADKQTLGVEGTIESPGSSVFDLPLTSSAIPLSSSSPARVNAPYHASRIDTISERSRQVRYTVISGGTGGNAICPSFPASRTSYILPVSDDGGSSSEIIRVLGGPSIGDLRSRLIRLIPPAPEDSPLEQIRKLMSYRLPATYSEREARDEWRDIVEGRSALWKGIPSDRKETIRGFLVYFESELLKRAHKSFTFVNGSIGNYFLAAAQHFFRSLPSAIFLFSSITNSQEATILPVIVTNHTVTIAVELENGGKLVGQCEISHPIISSRDLPAINIESTEDSADDDDDGIPGTSSQQRQNLRFDQNSKDQGYESLSARISRLYYINAYGNEIFPSPNPDYLLSLNSSDILVYSCGSLWTSIIPCLALRGVARSIARSPSLKAKILLLNSSNDRETEGYDAVDYILAITRTLNASYASSYPGLGGNAHAHTSYPVSAFITDIVFLKGTSVRVDVERITALGVHCTEVEAPVAGEAPRFDRTSVQEGIERIRNRWANM